MERKGIPLVVIATVIFLSSVLVFGEGAETNRQMQKMTIGNIRTVGNRSISNTEILSKVRSRVGQLFDPKTAADDAKRIAELKGVDHSYYNTTVVDGKIQLTFAVVERDIVRAIRFVGNRAYKAKALRLKLPFKIADYLDPTLAGAAARTLTEFYRKKGFAFVEVGLDSEQLKDGKVVYTIEEGPRVKIKSVKLHGNLALKTDALKRALKTQTRKFFFWQGYYVEDVIDEDVVKLQNIYNKRSFLDAQIKVQRQFNSDRSSVGIIFEIDEGQIYTVETVEITGNKYFADGRLSLELKTEQGKPYSEPKTKMDAKRLLKVYTENGFVDAKVEHKRKFVSEGKVEVEFTIEEGQRFRIGRIDIVGNAQTQDKVVRRVLDEYGFGPGQWYNAETARGDGQGELEKRVKRMAVAEAATITAVGEGPGRKDVQVDITEGQTGMLMLGAGVASDSGVIGQLVFEQRNFDISDKPESLSELLTGQAFKGAGQSLRIALQPGTEVSEHSISFSDPYYNNQPTSLDVVGSSYERWRDSYDEERTKGYFGFEERLKNRWRKSISFRVENVDVQNLDNDAPQEIVDVRGDNALGGIKFGFGRDTTDDMFNPTAGYIFDTSYEQVAGNHTFGILRTTYRKYETIYEDLSEQKTVLTTKLLAATAVGDAPPFEKFYAGGTGTYGIRGFDYWGVSTRGLQRNVANPQRKDPIGSDWVFLANAEVTIPLVSESFSALLFVDSGAIDSGPYRASVGVGIQILIPQWFGPVPMRFEVAAPISKDDDDETQSFSFSIGRLF